MIKSAKLIICISLVAICFSGCTTVSYSSASSLVPYQDRAKDISITFNANVDEVEKANRLNDEAAKFCIGKFRTSTYRLKDIRSMRAHSPCVDSYCDRDTTGNFISSNVSCGKEVNLTIESNVNPSNETGLKALMADTCASFINIPEMYGACVSGKSYKEQPTNKVQSENAINRYKKSSSELATDEKQRAQQDKLAKQRQIDEEKAKKLEAERVAKEGDGSPDDLRCKGYGLKPQSQGYAECRMRLDLNREQAKEHQRGNDLKQQELQIRHQQQVEQQRQLQAQQEELQAEQKRRQQRDAVLLLQGLQQQQIRPPIQTNCFRNGNFVNCTTN